MTFRFKSFGLLNSICFSFLVNNSVFFLIFAKKVRDENIVLSPLSLPGSYSSASTIHMHALDIVSIFIPKVNVLMVVLSIVFYCCLLNTNIDNYQLMLAFFPCVIADTKF
jgi:hypothetical protein